MRAARELLAGRLMHELPGLAAIVVLAAACDPSGLPPAADAAPAPDAPAGQGSEPRGAVAINELAPSPTSGADWIELANRSDQEVDISGWFVTDATDRLDHYLELPPGTVLGAGAYLIVWADDAAPGDGLHAPFKLGRADGVYLVTPDGIAADGLLFLALAEELALARLPDRHGLFFPASPSPAAPNPGASP